MNKNTIYSYTFLIFVFTNVNMSTIVFTSKKKHYHFIHSSSALDSLKYRSTILYKPQYLTMRTFEAKIKKRESIEELR